MKKSLIYLVILLACGSLSADEVVFGDNFQRGTLDAYLENAKVLGDKAVMVTEKGVDGKVLKSAVPFSFKAVPVSAQTKYQLSFRGRQQGMESIEENPRLSELIFNCRSFLPWCRLKFLDTNGKEVKNDFPTQALPFGQWHEYKLVFYPPMNSALMQFEINTGASKQGTIWLANAKLAPAPDEQSINVNPTFSYGPYNYSGWSSFNSPDGRLHEIEGGKTVLDTGFSATTTSFPLQEPGTYQIRLKATGNERNYDAFLIFIGADGKELSRIEEKVWKPAKGASSYKEATSYFVLPKGTVRGYFLVYHSVLAEIRLTRVGGEEKYKELVK